MSDKTITIARVYALEGHDYLNQALTILRDQEKLAGVTVIRGIAGFGANREVHTSSLLNLSLELPLIIEFYDTPEKINKAIDALKNTLDLPHIVSWLATAHTEPSS
ncbi:MAG: hypothetical protein CVV13_06625 [Gammaproteobacteria bacterium HGW-Gammaproteobacteria-3]|jgi:hypothetical protein|nr:MAG: hypothetical protein CVV13_06625 [Gammaproteobacteria bacterium HGW-Gammaproteobacteria-3]